MDKLIEKLRSECGQAGPEFLAFLILVGVPLAVIIVIAVKVF